MFKFLRRLFGRSDQYPLPDSEAEGELVRDTDDGRRFQAIAEGNCPHCKNRAVNFYAGPSGGLSQNIQCELCGWWFNVTIFPGGLEGIAQDIGFKSRSDDKFNTQYRGPMQ